MRLMFPGIHTKDLEVSYTFYTEVLGMKEATRFSPGPGINIVLLKDDESGVVELIENQNAPQADGASSGSKVTIVFGVKDMDRTLAELKEKGLTPTRGPMISLSGEKFAFFRDPDGVEIEIGQEFRL